MGVKVRLSEIGEKGLLQGVKRWCSNRRPRRDFLGVWTKGQTGVLGLISHVTWTMDHSLTIYHTDNPYSLERTAILSDLFGYNCCTLWLLGGDGCTLR